MRIHVAGLDRNITLIELVQMFDGMGAYSAFIAQDRDTGRGRGFGYISVPEGLSAKVLAMDGSQYRGKTLRLTRAKNRVELDESNG